MNASATAARVGAENRLSFDDAKEKSVFDAEYEEQDTILIITPTEVYAFSMGKERRWATDVTNGNRVAHGDPDEGRFNLLDDNFVTVLRLTIADGCRV